MEQLMTSQQVADMLRIHKATVNRYVARHDIEPAQVVQITDQKKMYLFHPADIAELAKSLGLAAS